MDENKDSPFYEEGQKSMKIDRVVLPDHEGERLEDQDDIVVWTKFNIILQAVAELHDEFGDAGDATRQLRVVVAEVIRRDMFGFSVREREPTDELLWTWYEVIKQFLEGANLGKWPHVEGDNRQYTEVVLALKARGHEMPKQALDVDPLLMIGRAIT